MDMKVTTEEKRIHDWAITDMGGEFETVFELDNGASLMRGNLENLEKPSRVFLHWDHDLRTPFTDFKSQYEIFSRNLAVLARFNMEVLKMRNMDLVFIPILDTVNYFLVVFNFKNPSIVVLDNRHWEGCDMDDAIGNYEHVVDILTYGDLDGR
ncbi:hypothetical protein L6452_42138 [Arctium lappa]|uniref:Uncharacterized protein n=1 Tax=Arctium lappa TaxID=4217 RepID=A0ACB8XGX6_ARCLA|nr:hypothetical protein L6452_42138 [Arctium lappa]